MNEFDYKTLLEKRWRHKLTPSEEASVRAWLAQHPESRAEWDLETQLAEALGCSVSATKSLIHRGRETLKERLKAYLRTGEWKKSD